MLQTLSLGTISVQETLISSQLFCLGHICYFSTFMGEMYSYVKTKAN